MPGWELPDPIQRLLGTLLIGLLIGAEREVSQEDPHAGLRDFLLIALTGGLCGLLGTGWLTLGALLAITAFVLHQRLAPGAGQGITTEVAAIATFVLCYFATAYPQRHIAMLALGISIAIAALLAGKRVLHRFVKQQITAAEFSGSLLFLALIFIVYPLLPEGAFGPYGGIRPRAIWVFVILVSSISFAGYFLEKFLGAQTGLWLTSVLGGLASTTAATSGFARRVAENRDHMLPLVRATLLANTMQFPRLLLLLALMSPPLARRALPSLLLMTAAGLLLVLVWGYRQHRNLLHSPIGLRNPFRLGPALRLGAVFGAILFASTAAGVEFGSQGIYWTSVVGGSVDVDAVALSLTELLRNFESILPEVSRVLWLALAANGLVKSLLAFGIAGAPFGGRVATSLAVVFLAGATVL